MGYDSSIELVYDASSPSCPHLVEADGTTSPPHYGHDRRHRGRHVRSRSDSHALGIGIPTLPRSKSLIQDDDDDAIMAEPHHGGVEVTRQPSGGGGGSGGVWGAPTADIANFSHWVYQPKGAGLDRGPQSLPPQHQPHFIPDDPAGEQQQPRPRSIIRNKKKRRPPSPEPPPHLMAGDIFSDDEEEEDDDEAPIATNALDTSATSRDNDDDFLGGCLGLMDTACAATLCRNVQWRDPSVVSEIRTRPRMKRSEVGNYFYQRDDYKEFKMQYRRRNLHGADSDSDDESATGTPPPQEAPTVTPSEMEVESDPSAYDYCSSSATSALCGASDAFWGCFPSTQSTETTSAA